MWFRSWALWRTLYANVHSEWVGEKSHRDERLVFPGLSPLFKIKRVTPLVAQWLRCHTSIAVRHRLNPWSRKIPHAEEQLSPWATSATSEACSPRANVREAHVQLESISHSPQLGKVVVLCNKEDPVKEGNRTSQVRHRSDISQWNFRLDPCGPQRNLWWNSSCTSSGLQNFTSILQLPVPSRMNGICLDQKDEWSFKP